MTGADVAPYLNQQGSDLHDLRKQIKHVRYQTEFFLDFFSRAYKTQTEEFHTLQDVLGELQDSAVLSQFLAQVLGKHWPQPSGVVPRHLLSAIAPAAVATMADASAEVSGPRRAAINPSSSVEFNI